MSGWMYLGVGDIAHWDIRIPQPEGTSKTLAYAKACMEVCEAHPDCHGFTDRGSCNFKTGKPEGECCDPKPYTLKDIPEKDGSSAKIYWKCGKVTPTAEPSATPKGDR